MGKVIDFYKSSPHGKEFFSNDFPAVVDYFLVVSSSFSWVIEVTSILLKENSVKPNIKLKQIGLDSLLAKI